MLHTAPDILAEKTTCPLSTADGSAAILPIYVARPRDTQATKRPALVVLQEIFGVNDHIQSVVRRFASQGYVVVAPDLFHRTAHWISLGYTQDDRPQAMGEARKLTEATVLGDITAALDFLAAQPDVDASRIGVTGYCMGGRFSFMTAARLPERVKAAAVYYGGGLVPPDFNPAAPTGPLALAGHIQCPVIAFFGAKDAHIPRTHVEALDNALAQAGVTRDVYYYTDAGHGFFCDARAEFHPVVAQDAWHRTLTFFAQHLGPVPAVNWLA